MVVGPSCAMQPSKGLDTFARHYDQGCFPSLLTVVGPFYGMQPSEELDILARLYGRECIDRK